MYILLFLCIFKLLLFSPSHSPTSGMLTKNNFVTMTHFFKVKNTQANPVKLKVMEQVPLSSDERLKVTLSLHTVV